jgi:hypothetical protein
MSSVIGLSIFLSVVCLNELTTTHIQLNTVYETPYIYTEQQNVQNKIVFYGMEGNIIQDRKLEYVGRAISIYINDTYICTVTSETANRIIEYYKTMCDAVQSKNPEIVSVQVSSDIVYKTTDTMDAKYYLTYKEAINKLTTKKLKYKNCEITPTDTLESLAEKVGVSEDVLITYDVLYNNVLLAKDWSNRQLVVGAKIQYPIESDIVTIEYCKQEEELQYVAPTCNIIYDETMFNDELINVQDGTVGLVNKKYEIYYNLNDEEVRRNLISSEVIAESTMGTVRIGTKKRENFAEVIPQDKKYMYPIIEESAYISAYMGDARGHKGIDIAAPYATPIYAMTDGVVSATGNGWNSGYGNAVVIQNTDGNVSRYAHMSWFVVVEGETVKKGQLIGYVGSTGNSTGNHLHVEVLANNVYRNPLNYM